MKIQRITFRFADADDYKAFHKALIDDDLKPQEWFDEQKRRYLNPIAGERRPVVAVPATTTPATLQPAYAIEPASGEVKWPESYDTAKLAEKREELDSGTFEQEFRNAPVAPDDVNDDSPPERHWNELTVQFGEAWVEHIEEAGGWGEMDDDLLGTTATQAAARLKMKLPGWLQKQAREWVEEYYGRKQ